MPSPSADRSRKAAKLSNSLQRDLATYALAVGAAGVAALALAPSAEAQIVYTPTHESLTKDGHISIDLNNDGIVDVTIREIPCTQGTLFYANSLQAIPEPGGGIVQGFAILTAYAKAMSPGSVIGGRRKFFPQHAMMYEIDTFGAYYYGSWALAGTKYLGIRFLIGNDVHYGWARMTVDYDAENHSIAALLSGYAYETQPNAPIRAADTGKNDDAGLAQAFSPTLPQAKSSLGALARGAFRSRGRCGKQ